MEDDAKLSLQINFNYKNKVYYFSCQGVISQVVKFILIVIFYSLISSTELIKERFALM